MQSPNHFHETATGLVQLPVERWRSVNDVLALHPETIEHAVVFILALWSGTSVQLLKAYSTAMASLEPLNVPLIVVDVDSIRPESSPSFPPNIQHGIGETYFIQKGIVVEKIETLFREEKKTVVKSQQPIDLPKSVQYFSSLFTKAFRKE
jgi:hypothetical protein